MTGAGVQQVGPGVADRDAVRAVSGATWQPLVVLAGALGVVAVLVAGFPDVGFAVVAWPLVVLGLPAAALLLTRGNVIVRARRAGVDPDVAGYGAAVLLALVLPWASLAGVRVLPGPGALTALCLLGVGLVARDRWLSVPAGVAAVLVAPLDLVGPFAAVLDRPVTDPARALLLALVAVGVLATALLVRRREARLPVVAGR